MRSGVRRYVATRQESGAAKDRPGGALQRAEVDSVGVRHEDGVDPFAAVTHDADPARRQVLRRRLGAEQEHRRSAPGL